MLNAGSPVGARITVNLSSERVALHNKFLKFPCCRMRLSPTDRVVRGQRELYFRTGA